MEIKRFGYYWLDTWVLANVIQLATQDFCHKFLNRSNDPCGRQYDQMTQAARSAPANIAEGNSRHSTSKETEMRLTDVARATLAELSNDFLNWLMRQEQVPWSVHSQEYIQVSAVRLEKPLYQDDVQHQSSIHILRQKHLFDAWLQSDDSIIVANCILVLCNRLTLMLNKQIERLLHILTSQRDVMLQSLIKFSAQPTVNGNYMLELCRSRDGSFAAIQLLQFKQMIYEPVTALFILDGIEAETVANIAAQG